MNPPRSWGLEIAMVLALILTSIPLLWPSALIDIDIAVRDFSEAHRPDWANEIAYWAAKFGQGGLLGGTALGVSALVALRRRSVRPLIAFMATYLLAGSVLVLKYVTERVAPRWPGADNPPYATAEQATFFSGLEPAMSFPSGHALNTIIWFGFVVLVVGGSLKLWQRRVLLYGPAIITGLAITYLNYHWLTDTPAGIFIGVLIIRFIQRIPWATVELPGWLEPERRYL